jgi:hypothetical protein
MTAAAAAGRAVSANPPAPIISARRDTIAQSPRMVR